MKSIFLALIFSITYNSILCCSLLRRVMPFFHIASKKPLTPTQIYNGQYQKEIEAEFPGALTSPLIQNCIRIEQRFPNHIPFYNGYNGETREKSRFYDALYLAVANRYLFSPKLGNFTHVKPLGSATKEKCTTEFFNDAHVQKLLDQHKESLAQSEKSLNQLDFKPFDHQKIIKRKVVCANFTPLGNINDLGESSFVRYWKNFNTTASKTSDDLMEFFTQFDFDEKHLPEAIECIMDNSSGGGINQILIPKEKVPKMVYLSCPFGIPCKFNPDNLPVLDIINRYHSDPRSMPIIYDDNGSTGELQARILCTPEMYDPNEVTVFSYGKKYTRTSTRLDQLATAIVDDVFKRDRVDRSEAFNLLCDRIEKTHKHQGFRII